MGFTHLHVHTEHSFLDGIPTLPALCERVGEVNQEAVAITDHGEVSGHLRFQKAAESQGIKPIFGMEGYFTENRHEKQGKKGEFYEHMTLLAKNEEGLHNLWALSSRAWMEGTYYGDPRFDWALLELYHEGIIATGGCMGGCVSQFLNPGHKSYNPDKSLSRLGRFLEIFGDDFLLEVHTFDSDEARVWNKNVVELGNQLSVPIIAVSDSHYLRPEDWEKHELLTAIQMGRTITSKDRFQYGPNQLCIFSESEVRSRLAYLGENVVDEAISNTGEVASSCGAIIKQDRSMPVFFDTESLDARELIRLANQGFERKIHRAVPSSEWETYRKRLDYELELVIEKRFPGYFLFVWDITTWAKKEGMLVGPARGSAGGSVLSWVLDITELDPLRAGLIFERFLDPGRNTLPDIDIDFPRLERGLVRAYLENKYGRDNIATIGTLNTLKPRALLRDLGRGLNIPQHEVTQMAAIIEQVKDIDTANVEVGWGEILQEKGGDLAPWVDKYPYLFELMEEFNDHIRHSGAHAAGTVVSKDSLIGRLPLRWKSEDVRTQMDMSDVEELGFVKIDILGLRTLSTLMRAWELAHQKHSEDRDWKSNPPEFFYNWQYEWDQYYQDDEVFRDLWDGKNIGIFQIETPGLRSLMKEYLCSSIEDICALISVFRPGITRAFDEETGVNLLTYYMQKRAGKREIKYKHPLLEQVTGATYGSFVYQEQVMKACQVLAGYTLAEADRVRKILGKMLSEKMKTERETFVNGCWEHNQIPSHVAHSIFDDMESFGVYGYNKSHGYAYAIISYWCAWFKYHYPREFMTALFQTNEGMSPVYTREARRLGIDILGPDINESGPTFTLTEDGVIRYGMGKIKNLAGGAYKIQEFGRFTDMADFVKRVPMRMINKRAVISMARVGALDSLVDRESEKYEPEWSDSLNALYQYWLARGDWKNLDKPCGGEEGECSLCQGQMSEFECEAVHKYLINDKAECERELLGTLVSVDPLGPYHQLIQQEQNFRGLGNMFVGEVARLGGLITSVRQLVTKTGRNPGSPMCQFWVELPLEFNTSEEEQEDSKDEVASGEVLQIVSFPDTYQKYGGQIDRGVPVLIDVEKLDTQSLMLKRFYRLDHLGS